MRRQVAGPGGDPSGIRRPAFGWVSACWRAARPPAVGVPRRLAGL